MITVDMHQMKQHFDEIVRMVEEEGETFAVTDKGKVVVRLVPGDLSPASTKQDLEAFWANIDRLTAKISSYLPEKVDAVEIVREGRRDLGHNAAWTNLERLATEIGAHWKDDVSAVDAIHDVRREL